MGSVAIFGACGTSSIPASRFGNWSVYGSCGQLDATISDKVSTMTRLPSWRSLTRSRRRGTCSVMICCFAKFFYFYFDHFKKRAGTNSQLIKSKKCWKTKMKRQLLIKEDAEQKLHLFVDFIKIPCSKFNLGCVASQKTMIFRGPQLANNVTCQRKASNKKLIWLFI